MSDGPLRWVGYDLSAYVIAKSSVLAEMMREAGALPIIIASSCDSICLIIRESTM